MAVDTCRITYVRTGGCFSRCFTDQFDRSLISFSDLDRLLFLDSQHDHIDPTNLLHPTSDHPGKNDLSSGITEQFPHCATYQREEYNIHFSRDPGQLPDQHALADTY